jgi:hypothetical protein
MKHVRNVMFVVFCAVIAFSWQQTTRANYFTLPGGGCGCGDPFPCLGQCGNDCLDECNRMQVDCGTWLYDCGFDECWCGYQPAN